MRGDTSGLRFFLLFALICFVSECSFNRMFGQTNVEAGLSAVTLQQNTAFSFSTPSVVRSKVVESNQNPVASATSVTTLENTPVNGVVTATDADGDMLTFSKVSDPAHGSVVVNTDGTYTYTPNLDYSGSDSFVVGVTDGNGGSATATVSVTVTPVTPVPVITLPKTTMEDSPLYDSVSATDDAGNIMTYSKGVSPVHGVLIVSSDGNYLYTPDKDFNGKDSFTIIANNGKGGLTSVKIVVTVLPVNDDPVLTATPVTTQEDTPLNGKVTATDVDGDVLTFTKGSDPSHGTLVFNSDGTYIYTPAKDYHGDDSFTVSVSDGNGGTATGTILITVVSVNDDPVITVTPVTTQEDTPVNGAASATDVDGDALTFSKGSDPAHGTVDVLADGTYTYTPAKDYNGDDSFTVSVSDGNGGTASATVTVTITPVNDDPVLTATPVSTQEDTPLNGNVTATDVDGDALTFSKVSDPSHGTVDVHSDGTYTYTPAKDYNGDDGFTISVSDGNGGSASATVTITITPVNDDPVLTATPVTTQEDIPLNGSVTATDVDGDALTFTKDSDPSHGTLVFNSDGTYTYTPATNYHGDDSFTVSVSDGNGGTATGTVLITVTSVNDDPVIAAAPVTTPEDTPVTGTATASDVDGDVLTFTVGTVPSHGTVDVHSDGTYTYTPAKDYNGDDSFTISVSDGNGGSASATVTVTITPVNDDPVLTATPVTTQEDIPLNSSVTATDVDGDVLTFTKDSDPSHGTLVFNSDGTYTYTPATNYHGDDSFTVSVSDGNGGTATGTVLITVTSVNDNPVLTVTPVTTQEDTPVNGTATATDVDGDVLIFTVGIVPSHGTVDVHSDGSYVYTPAKDYNGDDSFTISVSDGNGGSASATVTVTITPVNDDPVLTATPVTTQEDIPLNSSVTATDVDGDVLTFTKDSDPSHGTLVFNSDGTYTYTPATNYHGDDSFTVSVSDGNGGTATGTVLITVTSVNDDPVIAAAPVTTPEDTPVTGTATASDVDGDVLTFTVGTVPSHGTVDVHSDGTYTYTPAKDYNGDDSFTISVSDGNGGSASATVTVTITPVNDAPVTTPLSVSTPEDTPLVSTVMAGATDVDGDVLTVTGFSVDGTNYLPGTTVVIPGKGTFILNANGDYTLTPDKDYNGSVPSVTYTVVDGNGGTATGDITLTVIAVNDDPVIAAAPVTTLEDTPVTGTATATDVDGDALIFSKGSDPAHGTVDVHSDGSYTYTPAKDYNGNDSFMVTVSDGNGGSATATVTVTITPVNDAPVLTATPITTPEDTPANGNVTATDVDGDALTFSKGSDPSHGTLIFNSDGTYTYTPATNYHGDDSFTVSVSDGNGGTATGTVLITVTSVNDNPVISAVPVTTLEDTPVTGTATATDVDGDVLTFTVGTVPFHGTVDVHSDGSYVYTPAKDYNGNDSFTISVSDGNGGSATATVTVTINPVNDAPVLTATPVTTPEDTPANGNITATDVDGDALNFTKDSDPLHGTLVFNSDGTYTYTPATNYHGDDSFTVSVSDGNGGTATGTVLITVTSVNDNPVLTVTPVTTQEDTPVNGTATATDVDGDVLIFTVGIVPSHGTVDVHSDGSYVYTPAKDYNGDDSFTISVSDGNGGTATATVTVTITPVNDAPVLTATPVTTPEDTPANGNVTATDVDGDALTFSKGSDPLHGTLVFNSDGTYTYSPAKDYHGDDSFIVSVSDGNGGTANGTVLITVTSVNDDPVIAAASVTTLEDTPVNGAATATDVDGDVLTFSKGSDPAHGTVDVHSDGSYTYTPAKDYNGDDSFTVTVSDGNGGIATATVAVTIIPVNDVPVALDDAVSVVECTSVSGTVAGNDTPSGDGGNVWRVKDNPLHGTVTLNTDGSYIYIPTPNYHGTDTFTYTLTDVDGDQSTATMTITVTPLSEKLLIVKQSTKPQQTSDGSFIWKYTIFLTNLQNISVDNILMEDDLAKVFTHGESFKVTNITASGNLKANGLYDGLNSTSTLLSGSYLAPLSKDSVVIEVQVYSHDFIGDVYNQALFEGFSNGTGQIKDAQSDDPSNTEASPSSPRATITFIPEVELHIPEGFSPNKDMYNDAFEIVHSGNVTLGLEVFNRWGNRVYHSADYHDDWDGKGADNLLGKDLPDGTYFYIVTTTNKKTSEIKRIKGSVTLRR
ncbi:Ig-like domain-containing protein [Paludibacter sp.]|uniref:Ig-like domain-containing protein n=1 Tax=Paludibacter sp. TaxID=1898105 RepID=UPI0025FEA41C|nr:Ig-like domain-containing protein [Paludibacter sp.]